MEVIVFVKQRDVQPPFLCLRPSVFWEDLTKTMRHESDDNQHHRAAGPCAGEPSEEGNMVLEAYFQSRDSFPGTGLMGEDLVDDSKTTDEIVEEVSTMMDIDKEIVAIWMRYHGFHIKTMEDGTVKWAIWRDMKPLL